MSFPHFAGVILRHGSHIFLLQRNEFSKFWPNYWGFPGGKLESDEATFDAARREIAEEIGIEISTEHIIWAIDILAHYIEGDRRNTLYLFDTFEGMPENLEPKIHSNIGWYELSNLPSPMIPHVREGLFALLDGKDFIEYDGV